VGSDGGKGRKGKWKKQTGWGSRRRRPVFPKSRRREEKKKEEEGFVPIVKDDLLLALQRFGQSMKDDSAFLSKIACH
jgi:hypothetical protein